MVVDGGYAKRPFLRPPRRTAGWWSAACARTRPCATAADGPSQPKQRGPQADLRQEADLPGQAGGQTRGWQQVECVQYGERVTKTIKTFLATWRPAGGVIRVVLVKEEDGWLPFFSTNPRRRLEGKLSCRPSSLHPVRVSVWGSRVRQNAGRPARVLANAATTQTRQLHRMRVSVQGRQECFPTRVVAGFLHLLVQFEVVADLDRSVEAALRGLGLVLELDPGKVQVDLVGRDDIALGTARLVGRDRVRRSW